MSIEPDEIYDIASITFDSIDSYQCSITGKKPPFERGCLRTIQLIDTNPRKLMLTIECDNRPLPPEPRRSWWRRLFQAGIDSVNWRPIILTALAPFVIFIVLALIWSIP